MIGVASPFYLDVQAAGQHSRALPCQGYSSHPCRNATLKSPQRGHGPSTRPLHHQLEWTPPSLPVFGASPQQVLDGGAWACERSRVSLPHPARPPAGCRDAVGAASLEGEGQIEASGGDLLLHLDLLNDGGRGEERRRGLRPSSTPRPPLRLRPATEPAFPFSTRV